MEIWKRWKLYLSGALIYLLGILIFRYLPYYENLLRPETQNTLLTLYIIYLIFGIFYYIIFNKGEEESKPLSFLIAIKKVFTLNFKLEKKEKVSIFFMLVKVFYVPLMLNFFFNNFNNILNVFFNLNWYPLALTLLFTLDTFIFAIGYLFEFKFLKNVVKSVEPTFFGWFVALICYPPFNSMVGGFVPWGANDYITFGDDLVTNIARIVLVGLLIIYVWASYALGFKASNLTNRGIVSKFPYSVIRHPAYISKNLLWWITLLPVINWQFALGMGFWTTIYFFRAITEERHLRRDPEYRRYCRKVKYKFIPYVY